MKTKHLIARSLLLLSLATCHLQPTTARAQGTAFTYQGRLNNGTNPATGIYNFRFHLYDASMGGNLLGGPLTNSGVAVTNGLFTVVVDFGAGVFTGGSNWLSIGVCTNGSSAFTALTPHQQVTPTPYAISAQSANTAMSLASLVVQQNADGAPNMIGGSSVNLAASGVEGATIGGGGAVNYEGTGGYPNSVAADFGTIAGGDANQILSAASGSTIAGGQRNTIQASSDHAAIGGGMDNSIGQNDWEGTIAGGWHNTNDSAYSFIGGGQFNTIWANSAGATIAGGEGNVIGRNCPGGTIAGGQGNSISGSGVNPTRFPTNAFVAGGAGNIAIGNYSFAAGFSATAWDDYSFVWNDGNGDLGASSGPHTVTFYAAGGYYFIDGLGGAQLLPNATSWTTLSDRNAKKNFQPVDTAAVLAKLATIPVQQWNYKWEQDGDVPNLGPMAQDFKAAFYPGRDDKGISTLEFDGVELAAIQGLNQKLNEKDVEIQALKQSVAELKAMVEKLAHK